MDKKDTIQKTGGQFILDPINNTSIFTREDFTSEHSEIHKMVMDFDKERVLSQKEKIEYELEETINSNDLDVKSKINRIKELLKIQTENLNSIQLWSSYINGLTNKNKEEK